MENKFLKEDLEFFKVYLTINQSNCEKILIKLENCVKQNKKEKILNCLDLYKINRNCSSFIKTFSLENNFK
jgi:hypothetical protein